MAIFNVPHIQIAGISACVPSTIDRNSDYPGLDANEKNKLIASIGVEEKRICPEGVCSSDLCFQAATKLIEDLQWDKKEIECLIFVSQTPDYILPATSCILQYRLGLSKECYTLDISLGCSGWVYGLSAIASIMSASHIKKALLLVGDTTSKTTSREDKSSWPLFGDAGTATALTYTEEINNIVFHTGSDGSGSNAIIIPDGGCRNPFSEESLRMEDIGDGIRKSKLHCILEGMDLFSFGITQGAKSVKKVLEKIGKENDQIDYFLFHQANLLLNETIRKKLKIPLEKVPYSLKKYGNTSCASIPLTMVTNLSEELSDSSLRIIACGFGVGLSWATAYFETDKIVCPKLLEYQS